MIIEDEKGNTYSENYGKLLSVYPGIHSIQIKKEAVAIYGKSSDDNAFFKCRNIQSVTFEEGSQLTTIENYSFYKCYSLSTLDLRQCTKLSTIQSNAFLETKGLMYIHFPTSLKLLGERCFSRSGLINVEIPSSVTNIENNAFFGCNSLQKVKFMDGIDLKNITKDSFARTALTSFDIPPSLTSFNTYALHGNIYLSTITAKGNNNFKIVEGILCSGDEKTLLTCPAALNKGTIKVPSCVNTIADCGFHCCQANRIEIGSNVNKVGSFAFRESIIESIVFPDTIEGFTESLMEGCINLKRVNIPSKVKTLTTFLFRETGLETITLPDTVNNIANRCFYCSELLGDVFIPSSVTYIEGGIFAGCPKVNVKFLSGSDYSIDNYNVIVRGSNLIQYVGKTPDSTVVISSSIYQLCHACFAFNTNIKTVKFEDASKLSIIEINAFYQCYNLESFQFPPSLTTIVSSAFESTGLLSIVFGEKVTSFGKNSFYNCSKLQTVKFAATTTGITFGNGIFDNCTKLTGITFPAGLTTIGKYFLRNATSLDSVELPSSITLIDEYAFFESGLASVTIHTDQVYSIASRAFYGCKYLSKFSFHDDVSAIGDYAFCKTALSDIIIPNSVTSLGNYCFSECMSLKTVSLSNQKSSRLSSMGEAVFQGCPLLSSIGIENEYFVRINDAIYSKDLSKIFAFPPASDMHFIYLPENVRTISAGTFYSCKNLYSVIIPDNSSLEVIGASSFFGCVSLRNINIPISVNTIGVDCFFNCDHLTCDLVISNTNSIFRKRLVDIGKMPKRCIYPCEGCRSLHCSNIGRISISLLFIQLALISY